jgi:hypothetical protein
VVFEVHIIDGEHERFAHAQAVVVDDAKQRPVAGGLTDPREETLRSWSLETSHRGCQQISELRSLCTGQ